ncbi:L-serine ammonia-lyase [Syntrophobotulus glycolicus DSM 8271]|uniref:L-serine dehydratase n=1 Tax=Syntrophobotulus glycolicus (strain DSM 8271 / FlGlyR) TaxID=645991 RepID=F0SUG3_SYNGF|nr:L-serine ammonia-lyase, iron-sulfur-dependent, subunit alpha [Syntrophobotulus glycolicus]ADY56613.1 L-serine ammonia-lyase [Syntrophobotulus glycolicus DSM 8271]
MRSCREIIDSAQEQQIKISQVVLNDQAEKMNKNQDELIKRMTDHFLVMKDSAARGLTGDWHSQSGLAGGDASKMEKFRKKGKTIIGDSLNKAVARAVAVAEVNAGMGRIVAAPTAGSCGVLPAVFLTVQEVTGVTEEEVVRAMFTAAGLGMVIAERATVSGAEGGCQAEIGSASAMAAGAAVELAGGSPEQIGHAAAMALKSFLGLVCDPVAGLVEVPCIKRNAMAAVIAMTAAEMALAGVRSAIPVDEVIDAMASIGKQIPCALKETAMGGLAATPAGKRIKETYLAE